MNKHTVDLDASNPDEMMDKLADTVWTVANNAGLCPHCVAETVIYRSLQELAQWRDAGTAGGVMLETYSAFVAYMLQHGEVPGEEPGEDEPEQMELFPEGKLH